MSLRKFLSGLAEGLAATGSILEPRRYPSMKGSDLSRLRGDVSRVGSDFYAVIEREHCKPGPAKNRRFDSGLSL